jgi:hypothetical protein
MAFRAGFQRQKTLLGLELARMSEERDLVMCRKAAKVMGYETSHSDDFMVGRGLQWIAERGTVEINHHPEGFSLSCNSKEGVSGASVVYKHLADAVAECILNMDHDEKHGIPTKPCVKCGKRLEPAVDHWKTYQPFQGCEIQIIGSFGSTRFDKNIHNTVFRGVICDDCATEFVGWMDEQSEKTVC